MSFTLKRKIEEESDDDDNGAEYVEDTVSATDVLLNNRGISNSANVSIEKFYIGCQEYEYKKEETTTTIFSRYLEDCFNGVFWLLNHDKNITHFQHYITHFFVTILRYNHVYIHPEIYLNTIDDNVRMVEPAIYQYVHNKSHRLILHFSRPLIERLLNYDNRNIQITFDQKLKTETTASYDRHKILNASEKYRPIQIFNNPVTAKKLYSLFVIADHMATHYLQDYRFRETDWVNHANFGLNCGVTISSIYNLTAVVSNKPNTSIYNDLERLSNQLTSFPGMDNLHSFSDLL